MRSLQTLGTRERDQVASRPVACWVDRALLSIGAARVNPDPDVKPRLREFSGLSLGCGANQGG